MKTFAIAGCGHLGKIIAAAYANGLLEGYKLVAAYSLRLEDSEALVKGTDAEAVNAIEDIIAKKPDFIIETASIALLKGFALNALDKGISIIPLSIGAFADSAFRKAALEAAEKSGARIYIPSGAVGGFDVLRTISLISEYNGWDIKAGLLPFKRSIW